MSADSRDSTTRSASANGLRVDLATVRIEPDGVHVHTRRQPLAANDGLGGVCRRRDDVGTPDRLLV